MSTMQLLPDLSEYLASALTHEVSSLAEPGCSYMVAMLKLLSHSELVDLRGGLSGWLAGMKAEQMVERYTHLRQLILLLVQVYGKVETR